VDIEVKMDELPVMLAAVLEIIYDDDIEMDLIDEYIYPGRIAGLIVNQQLRPSPFVGIRNYIQDTVWRYPDDLLNNISGCLEMLIMYCNPIEFKHNYSCIQSHIISYRYCCRDLRCT
jgi:hypothetical protein